MIRLPTVCPVDECVIYSHSGKANDAYLHQRQKCIIHFGLKRLGRLILGESQEMPADNHKRSAVLATYGCLRQ